jgi:hypothetical protein
MAETIRALRREDIPAIAGMFSRVFLKRTAAPSPKLTGYFDELLIPASGSDGEPRSRVFVDAAGTVRGFIGIWPRRMVLDGRTIEAAAAGALMVDDHAEHPTAGARLLRAFLSGPQDLSFSETANGVSQGMWERVGGKRLPTASLDWVRVLRPAGFGIAAAGRSFRPAWALRPVAAGIDLLIDKARLAPELPGEIAGFSDAEVSTEQMLQLIPQLSDSYGLRPDWQSPDLSLLMAHAESKERYGELQRRLVYGRNGAPVACYLYHARPGDIARVLQVLALPGAAPAALTSLLRHAASLGCVAVRGRTDPAMFDTLVAHRCVFYHGSAMVLHARNKVLLDDVLRSRALLTGLAGESWSRLIGGRFA